MRTSALITVSLPPGLLVEAERLARKKHMTRSELYRTALRRYLEETKLDKALRVSEEEMELGKAKTLRRGGLAVLLQAK